MKKAILMVGTPLAKSRVEAYTRKDGTLVSAHDNGRQAAAPKPAAGRKKKAPAFDHPNVVAHNVRMTQFNYEPGKGSKEQEAEHPADADTVHFAGKRYSWTSKTGNSMHDKTPVRQFEHEESGHRIWVDEQRRVHADSTSEVEHLRKQHAEHEAKQAAPAAKPKKVLATKPAGAGAQQVDRKQHKNWHYADNAHASNRIDAEEAGFKQSGYRKVGAGGHEFTYSHDDGRKRVVRVKKDAGNWVTEVEHHR